MTRNFGLAAYDCVVELGTNAKMSELSAALGLSTLERLGDFVARNGGNHDAYESQFQGYPVYGFVAWRGSCVLGWRTRRLHQRFIREQMVLAKSGPELICRGRSDTRVGSANAAGDVGLLAAAQHGSLVTDLIRPTQRERRTRL